VVAARWQVHHAAARWQLVEAARWQARGAAARRQALVVEAVRLQARGASARRQLAAAAWRQLVVLAAAWYHPAQVVAAAARWQVHYAAAR